MNDMDRIDVWCSGEKRVVGTIPTGVGLLTSATFWASFRPAKSEYRLEGMGSDHSLARCPRCCSVLGVYVSDVNVNLSEGERKEVAERRSAARAQYGDGQEVPTRAQLRSELERHPIAAGAVVRHFEAPGEGDNLATPIVLGSTRIV